MLRHSSLAPLLSRRRLISLGLVSLCSVGVAQSELALQSMEGAIAGGARPTDIFDYPGVVPISGIPLDTLIVDAHGGSSSYRTIQAAVDAARPGKIAVVRIAPGGYEEHIRIFPTGPHFCGCVLEALDPAIAPVVHWTHDPSLTKEDEGIATIEILNRSAEGPTCNDFRVAIWGLHVIASGQGYGSVIACRSNVNDVNQEWLTGLDIAGNRIECTAGGPAVLLGERSAELVGLWNQSAKWGWVRNNIISTREPEESDGGSSWRFIGFIADNEIVSASEGWHLGLARTDSRHLGLKIPAIFREATVQHNYFHCNTWNAFHFTHGSMGVFRNNIMTRGAQVTLEDQRLTEGTGIYIGPPPTGAGEELITRVAVHNNIAADNAGTGFMVHYTARVDFGGNISMHNGWELQDPEAGFGLEIRPSSHAAPGLTSNYNLFYENREDYSREDLEGPEDINEGGIWPDPGGAKPRFVGPVGSGRFSFMLQTGPEEHPCGYGRGEEISPAIDAGPYRLPDDEGGLGTERNDCGVYGGPKGMWDPEESNSCFEFWPEQGRCRFDVGD
jgi:hypothetical protein